MLVISVEFLHDTFRADPSGAANTGRSTMAEWPPSPARLFSALVAADGTRENCRMTNGAELAWFEKLPAPTIFTHARPCQNVLQPRYVVRHEGTASASTQQEYVGRNAALVRPGVRAALRDAHVVFKWDAEAPAPTFEALCYRAARIGYLGCSDSPVRVPLHTQLPNRSEGTEAYVPDDSGDVLVRVQEQGDLEILDRIFDEWRKHGAAVARHQFPVLRHMVRYRSPLQARVVDRGEVVAWLRLGRYVSGRRVSAVTALFKEALLSQHQRIHGEPAGVLHGHGFVGKGYELARYLALPDVGSRRSHGRIHGLALWMPPGSDSTCRRMARDAAHSIRNLNGRGVDVSVFPHEGEVRPLAAAPWRWLKASRKWVTAFPAIHERRRNTDLAEVARWCSHAGLPEPVGFRSERTPLLRGAIDLAPTEVNRRNRIGLPYSHVEIRFAERVPGPVVIGSGRQRGFGLCVPVDG